MKTKYSDSKVGVKKLVEDLTNDNFNPDIIEADPYTRNVWLALDTKKEMAMVVFIGSKDTEIVPYKTDNPDDYLNKYK